MTAEEWGDLFLRQPPDQERIYRYMSFDLWCINRRGYVTDQPKNYVTEGAD